MSRSSRAYVAAFLAVLLVLGTAMPAFAASQKDIDAHQKKAAAARKKAAAAQALANQLKVQTAALDKQISALQAQADALDPKIASATVAANKLLFEAAQMQARVAGKQADIEQTAADLSQERELLAKRVDDTYRQGDWFFIDVLLGARNFSDLIARTDLVTRVMSANRDAARNLRIMQTQLEYQKSGLDSDLALLQQRKAAAQAVEAKLKGLQHLRQGKVDAQQTVYNEKASLMAETKQNARRLLAIADAEEAESARIAAQLRRYHGTGKYHGQMAWPVPGYYTISSPFGWRFHPIFHKRMFHAGIDITGSGILGAPIVAAGGGTVIWAGPRGGYGNTVMIDHGNGVVTVYGHQRDGGIKVSVGQHVRKGQRIGTVGSTGNSTGPHCHFEVRVNGDPVNPMRYL